MEILGDGIISIRERMVLSVISILFLMGLLRIRESFIVLIIGIFIFLYLFNNLILYNKGLELWYFSRVGVMMIILCNVIILLPLILSQTKKIKGMDITKY